MNGQYCSIEKKIIGCFDREISNSFFENNLKISLDSDSVIKYNLKEHGREFDIIIKGNKRLNIGLLIRDDYNIEIEARKCNKNTILDKYDEKILFSVILVNGESHAVHDSKMPYSLIDFKENFTIDAFDFKNQQLPSLKNSKYDSSNPFNLKTKEYAFVPRVVNNNCEKVTNLIEKRSIPHLENILKSDISPNLKKGTLYYLCDNLAKEFIKKLNFIPSLMQVSFEEKNEVNNCLIDCQLNRKRISDYSVSKEFEQYLTKVHNKKSAKTLNSKKFSFITCDNSFADSCSGSELSEIYILKPDISKNSLNDYIKEIKKL